MEAGNNVPLATRIIRARKLETGQVLIGVRHWPASLPAIQT